MIQLKPSPSVLDQQIQCMQQFTYDQLRTIWNLSDADYASYGRAYRNQTEDGYAPEIFTGVGNDPNQPDYTDAFFSDQVKASSFFGVGEVEKYNTGSAIAQVAMIFQVNVPGLKPALTYRGDMEIRVDVQRLMLGKRFGFTMTGWETGIDNVFREYSGWKKKDGIKFRDEHPWHCFRLNFNVLYSIQHC